MIKLTRRTILKLIGAVAFAPAVPLSAVARPKLAFAVGMPRYHPELLRAPTAEDAVELYVDANRIPEYGIGFIERERDEIVAMRIEAFDNVERPTPLQWRAAGFPWVCCEYRDPLRIRPDYPEYETCYDEHVGGDYVCGARMPWWRPDEVW
jgi:hypothetical protein